MPVCFHTVLLSACFLTGWVVRPLKRSHRDRKGGTPGAILPELKATLC